MSTNQMDAVMATVHCQQNLELPGKQTFRQASEDSLDYVHRDEKTYLCCGQYHSLGKGPELYKLETMSWALACFCFPVCLDCGLI